MPIRPLAVLAGMLLAVLTPRPAPAIPLFAGQYGVTCQKCHTVIPQLNKFGQAFAANGFRLRGVTPGVVFPVSVRVNLVDSSAYQGSGPNGTGLPKAIVDEIELLSGGPIGDRASYFVEQYIVDGGTHGSLRDAWLSFRLNSWDARVPLVLQAGQFTLPLPVDPETFRQSYQHYTIYDQTVGNNPFNFFDDKDGAVLSAGSPLRGANAQVFVGGTDLMGYAQQVFGPFTVSAYRYQGERPDGPALRDRFGRTGYALVFSEGKWTSQSVLQTGWDSSCRPNTGCPSSGGFTQLQYQVSPRFFVLSRYEGTSDTLGGFARDAVFLAGYRPAHNSSFTLEDVVQRGSNTMNAQLTVAY